MQFGTTHFNPCCTRHLTLAIMCYKDKDNLKAIHEQAKGKIAFEITLIIRICQCLLFL